MSEADPTRKRGIGSERLVAEGANVFRKTTYIKATQLQPGQRVDGYAAPITNIFSNPDGSLRIVFEDAEEIKSLDRDDGLEVIEEA